MSRRGPNRRKATILRAVAVAVAAMLMAGACSDSDEGYDAGTGSKADDPAAASSDDGASTADQPSMTSGPLSSATTDWWAYQREPTFEVTSSPVDVPTRDGTTLGCDLGRPATGGSPAPEMFPGLVVEFTPYVALAQSYAAEAAFFVERGYNTLICTLRGVGRSGGTWEGAMSSQDGRDAHDLVEWLATQPFSDGRVGQLGESYGGQTSYGAAVEQPAHLKAVAPMQPPGNLYVDVIYPGGIKTTEGGTIDNWPGIAQGLSGGAVNTAAEYETNRAHPTFDGYWQDRAMVGRHDDIEVPVLTLGGWDDGYFRSGTLSNIEGALDRTWAVYGPWPHNIPVDLRCAALPCPGDRLPSGVLLAWFDHWVKELPDVPIPDEPTFVSYEGPKGAGAGWQELSHWDPEGTDAVVYELASDGTLAETAPATEPVTFHQPADPTGGGDGGAATFDTAPLDADRVLVGHTTLRLRATLSAGDANLYAELVDVAPDGSETVVNDGFLKAAHRESHEDPEPVEPGTAIDYEIEVRADHHRFGAGHTVRLRISGGTPDTLVPVATPVDVTIETGEPSTLRLPGFATGR